MAHTNVYHTAGVNRLALVLVMIGVVTGILPL
jgi:hypothetical protein